MSFSALLRLAGITVGIISVTILAWKGFEFPFNQFFFMTVGPLFLTNPAGFFATTPSPGLATLFAVIGGMAIALVLSGPFTNSGNYDTWWQDWLGSESCRMGLDILAVLGGATAIVAINQLLV